MTFVDTNYFLRFLRDDIAVQAKEARELFDAASRGKVRLLTSTIVFFEVYWVLTSFYRTQKRDVARVLQGIFAMSFIVLHERDTLSRAVEIFAATNVGLEDAYNLAYAQTHEAEDFKTFDKKLGKMFNVGIVRNNT